MYNRRKKKNVHNVPIEGRTVLYSHPGMVVSLFIGFFFRWKDLLNSLNRLMSSTVYLRVEGEFYYSVLRDFLTCEIHRTFYSSCLRRTVLHRYRTLVY